MIAFRIKIPKPIHDENVYDEMNTWLDDNQASISFDQRHWTPCGIRDPQFREWELLLPDDQQGVMFKLMFSKYILNQIIIK